MAVIVTIPTALRQFSGGLGAVNVDGDNVGEAMSDLGVKYPELKRHLFADDGSLRNFVNVFVNDENVRDGENEKTQLADGDEVLIVPAVAGGSLAADATTLSKEEIERYGRHLILPEVGMEGQKKLKAASICLIGAGGLGSPLALYLAAAGVGRIGIVDFDKVDFSNLQRQIIHGTDDVGRLKLDSAAAGIKAINPHCVVDRHPVALTSENALEILKDYDIVIDGTDNFPTRYLVNDACVILGKPNVYGSIFRFEGQATVFSHEDGPCYRCLYPDPPPPGMVPSCAEGGVLGVLPGLVGVIQATEAIKLILGQGTLLKNRLLLIETLDMKFRELKIRRDPKCPVCGENPTVTELIDYQQFCGMPAEGSEAAKVQMVEQSPWDISPRDLKDEMDAGKELFILDVRQPNEFEICDLGGLLIPLGQLPARFSEVPKDADIIVHCKIGGRSAQAAVFLKKQGYEKVRNLNGGILAWAEQVDPAVPKY